MEIKVRKVSGYKEVEISMGGAVLASGCLDEGEAVSVACQLIRAAEDLVPEDFPGDKTELALIREGLEA